MKNKLKLNNIPVADKINWWKKDGNFNLLLYLRICDVKRENI